MSRTLQYTLIDGIKCYSPDEASRYADYPDEGFDVTDKVEEDSFWIRSRNRLLKKTVLQRASEFSQPRMLEIGCGNGEFLQHIASTPGLQIIGSEIYVKGLRFAQKKLPNVEFIQFDAKHGVLPEKFDLIAAFDVIEHIDDDMGAISNVHEMLNEGGYFIVTVPQHKFLWSRLDQIVKHKRRYTRRELVQKLQARGFSVVQRTSFLFILFPLMAVNRLMDRPSDKEPEADADADIESRVSFPGFLNWIFDKAMRIDEALIAAGFSLPFGGTLLVVGRKSAT